MAESGIGLLVTETLAGLGSLDISGSHRAVEWSDLPIHCLHEFAHKQGSQLNSSVLITVWRVVIERV